MSIHESWQWLSWGNTAKYCQRESANNGKLSKTECHMSLISKTHCCVYLFVCFFLSVFTFLSKLFIRNTFIIQLNPAFNGISPITNTNSWSLQPGFFYFFCWLQQSSAYNRQNLLVPWNPFERDLTVRIGVFGHSFLLWSCVVCVPGRLVRNTCTAKILNHGHATLDATFRPVHPSVRLSVGQSHTPARPSATKVIVFSTRMGLSFYERLILM